MDPKMARRRAAATAAFARLGATVQIDPDGENLIRSTHEGTYVVEVQGLPNLVHELVHALVHGGLDDDHGFPYGEIPLNLARADHRALMWEELACCWLSSAFVHVGSAASWFAQQVEILPIFYGDPDLRTLLERIETCGHAHHAERDSVLLDARSRLAEALGAEMADGPSFPVLWDQLRAQHLRGSETGGSIEGSKP